MTTRPDTPTPPAAAEKYLLLNALLAGTSPLGRETYALATGGVRSALKDGTNVSLAEFAKRIMAVYNPDAKMEFLDFSDGHFAPLFAMPELAAAAKRLSGYPQAVLVVNGLSQTPRGRRRTKKLALEQAADFEFVEDFISGYRKTFPALKVFFI